MSTPEDRLAALLRDEGRTLVPSGDGLARIRTRAARRRHSRWVLPGGLVTAAAAAALVVTVGGAQDPSSLQQVPGGTASTTTSPSTTPSGGGLDHAFENTALWPFTSAQELARWRETYPYADDKTALVHHYVADVLQLPGAFSYRRPCEACDVVDISTGGRRVGQAALERFLVDGHPVYTISTVGETDLKLLSPRNGEAVRSPTRISGRIRGVDESVRISLVTQAGQEIGTGQAAAGSDAPWSGSVSWTDTGWTHGAVVLTTASAKDGSLTRLTAVPVLRDSTAPTSGPTLVALRGGRVDLFDAASGAFVKHLTYPAAGYGDTAVSAADTGSVLWVRKGSGCRDALLRLDDGGVSVVVPPGTYQLYDPRLSPDGRTVAYSRKLCRQPTSLDVVVAGPGGTETLSHSVDTPYRLFDVGDDGRLLLGEEGYLLLPPHATSLAQGTALRPASTRCVLGPLAFDAADIVALEQCAGGSARLARFDGTGRRTSTGRALAPGGLEALSARDGVLLLSVEDRVYTIRGTELDRVTVPAGVRSATW